MLDNERYLSLVTFRRDGREVATPIWFAEDAGHLVAFTLGDSGKVKRLRNSPRARFAACDARGKVRGPWRDGTARVVSEPAAVARALERLHAKYGWQMAIADFFSRLSGRYSKRAYLEIRPTS
jgi:PPOX class probable F420-dependent enzyme